jgi:D-glycero-beta-D-manno-heptose-7-phosphate kinase
MKEVHKLANHADLTADMIRDLVSRFRQKRVLVAGDVMLDEYLVGEVRRISPEAPVPVVDVTHKAHIPGGAANVAANIASLGGSPILLGLVGRDENANVLTSVLQERGVPSSSLVIAKERPTSTKTRIVSGQQQIVRLDKEIRSSIAEPLAQAVLDVFDANIADVDVCLLSDYAKGLLTPAVCQHIMTRACQLGKPVVVDPKGSDFTKYTGCSLITPNLRETEMAARIAIHSESDLSLAAAALHSTLGDSALLITRGAEGMTLFRKHMEALHVPALAREVFDVTGAGDTVVGTLALALAAHASLEQAMLLSNIAASIVVQKTGTATVLAEELCQSRNHIEHSVEAQKGEWTDSRSYRSVPNQSRITQ